MKNRQKIKKLLENFRQPSKGSARFMAKHLPVQVHADKDDVDASKSVKAHPRFKNRHGYDNENTDKLGVKDFEVYEGVVDPFQEKKEVISEISKDKLRNYISAAASNATSHARKSGMEIGKTKGDLKASAKHEKKLNNRIRHIVKASYKISKDN